MFGKLESLNALCSASHQELCKKIHAAIDKIDESRYDIEAKVQKADIEVRTEKLVRLLIPNDGTLRSFLLL